MRNFAISTKKFPFGCLCSAFLILLNLSCAKPSPEKHQELQFRGEHLKPLLLPLSQMADTPAQEWATQLLAQSEKCTHFQARGPAAQSLLDLLQQLKCIDSKVPERSGGTLKFNNLWWKLKMEDSGAATWRLKLQSQGHRTGGQSAFMLPSEQSMPSPLLNADQALFSLHGTSDDGLGLYGLLLQNQQVQDLFEVGSWLGSFFADARWSLAVFPPAPEQAAPGLVLAAGVKNQTLAIQFSKALHEVLGKKHQLSRRAVKTPQGQAFCFSEVPLFSGLAPCVSTTEDRILITWNEHALLLADGPTAASQATPALAGRLDFNLLAKANAQLQGRSPTPASFQPLYFSGQKNKTGYLYEVNWPHSDQP